MATEEFFRKCRNISVGIWTDGDNIEAPVFKDVTIDNKLSVLVSGHVRFKGTFSPATLSADDNTVLFLGQDNKLYWPTEDVTVGSCRGYFELIDITAGNSSSSANARYFVLNFDDEGETTAISTSPSGAWGDEQTSTWYTLDGRRLSQKPTQRGIYINNGVKIVIK